MVSVVHGIPGMTVDVYANGDELLSGFEPGTVTEPQSLKAYSYDIQIFEAARVPTASPLWRRRSRSARATPPRSPPISAPTARLS
ncbi:DUF4397 domain-containing protein [Streptomyces thermocarboxydus]